MYESCVPGNSFVGSTVKLEDPPFASAAPVPKAPIKEVTGCLRDICLENYELALKLRSFLDSEMKIANTDYPDRSDIRNDLIGDLIIQKDLRRILDDIFEILVGERP